MDWISAAALYFIIWWTVLFAVLPLGVEDNDEVTGAPGEPKLAKKAILTSLIAFAIWGVIFGLLQSGVVSLREMFGE